MGIGLKERGLAINEILKERSEMISKREQSVLNEIADQQETIEMIKENAAFRRDTLRNYKGIATKNLLSTSLKSIYISALESVMCLDEADYNLAEIMVDRYVNENGAQTILRHMKGKTFLLDRVRTLVEDSAEKADDKADINDKEAGNVPAETKDNMIEDLDKEEDVNSAVETIAKRISSAEEEFMKKNAEDKKKIEDIVDNINDRIQAVKSDITKNEEDQEEVEKECAIDSARAATEIYERRNHSVYDYMMHESLKSIVKDNNLSKMYLNESGKLDMDKVSNTVKVMYGFLEFVNTIQLETVDKEYIEKVIKEM